MTRYVSRRSFRSKRRMPLRRHGRTKRRAVTNKRKSRYPRRRPRGKLARLSKKVRRISNLQSSTLGHFTHRSTSVSLFTSAQKNADQQFYSMNSKTQIEDVIDGLKWFDPTTPQTRISVDFTAGTYSKSIRFVRSYMHLKFRANYLIPVHYAIYHCRIKTATSQSPDALYTTGVPKHSSGLTASDILIYPTDITEVTAIWSIKRIKQGLLQPGSEVHCRHGGAAFNYDPSITDAVSFENQPRFKSWGYFVNIYGVLSHEETADAPVLIGIGPAALDVQIDRTWEVEYDAGTNFSFLHTAGAGGDNFGTGNAVNSNKAAAWNQILFQGKSTI